MRYSLALSAGLLVACCLVSCGSRSDTIAAIDTRPVTLPNGKVIQAEVMAKEQDMYRGMMFRDSLAPDHGRLFIHGQPSKVPYYMYQVRIPLDILWIDADRRIVEISANTPPCKAKSPTGCPTYGGHYPAQWVLELAGGVAAKNGLAVGDVLSFY
jgi:uncharacterized membrane protein (UPF0127 family)